MTRKHPYSGLPDRQFWGKEPGIATPSAFDPVSDVPFRVAPSDKVVTAGSCFAQHLGAKLAEAGFTHYIAEKAHPIFSAGLARAFNYGTFSARYGNVYTARQFLQLLHRAYGIFTPLAQSWPARGKAGRLVDPFRPQIQPEGFVSEAELAADRAQHFAAIRHAIEAMDVFVFTLGLTECWEDRRDGAIYPLAPGVAGGVFDPETVAFRNFDLAETVADLRAALDFIRARNPSVRILLTVSPVPLNATFENRHVFVSTTVSKAVLRLAAEAVSGELEACAYFPSYEIITSPHVRGRYFAADCREVLPEGVSHVMGLFFRHFAGAGEATPHRPPTPRAPAEDDHNAKMARAMQVLCDEEAIDNR